MGLDVENRHRQTHTDLVRFARRRFSHKEAVRLEQFDDVNAQKNHFLELWTLKVGNMLCLIYIQLIVTR